MGESTWYKMDNVAKVFLASLDKRDPRSFRVSATLKEEVDPEALKSAAKITAQQCPQYQVTIRRGIFWHYMEQTEKLPVVEEEKDRPCPLLYGSEHRRMLHYKVSYFHKRISIDMFHALADGNGGLQYLNVLLRNYFEIKYPGSMDGISAHSGASVHDLNEDSFSQFFEKQDKILPKKNQRPKAYHPRGGQLPYNQTQFFELHMSVSAMLQEAKNYHTTLTCYLGALLLMSIYKDMPVLMKNKPITISMPVNLRNYFPSETGRNFFNSVYVTHQFQGGESIESLAKEFDQKLKEQLKPEVIIDGMNNFEKIEKLWFVRLVPLFIKNRVVASGAKKEVKRVSAVLSNLGKVPCPNEYHRFVDGYNAYCSTSGIFLTLASYEDDLSFGICSTYRNTGILKNFVKSLTEKGIEVTLYATEVVS